MPIGLNGSIAVLALLTLFYGFFVSFKLRNRYIKGKLADAWDSLLGLISLFIFGYIPYTAQVLTGKQFINPELASALVMLAGAVFIAANARIKHEALKI